MNDDALYRRYRRMIVKSSSRQNDTQKVFVVALVFCVALAAGFFAFSLHLITDAGGHWWITAVACGAGVLLAPLLWRGLPFLSIKPPWYGRLLRASLFLVFLLITHSLEQRLAPKTSDDLGFDIGLILALGAGVFPLIPLVLLPFDSPGGNVDATPPA